MSWDTIFLLSNLFVLPFWGMMLIAPKSKLTQRTIGSRWAIGVLPLVYLILIAPMIPSLIPVFLEPPALEPIRQLFTSDAGVTVGWIHFLAFDLFVGRWILLDATSRNLNSWLIRPVLLLTFFFGPIGLFTYLCVTRFSPPTGLNPKADPESQI